MLPSLAPFSPVFLRGFCLSPLVFAMANCAYANQIAQFYQPLSKSQASTAQAGKTPVAQSAHSRNAYCQGKWITPNTQAQHSAAYHQASNQKTNNKKTNQTASNHKASNQAADKHIYASADSLYVSADNIGELSGQVSIHQAGKTVTADKVNINLNTKQAKATGNIAMSDADVYSLSQEVQLDLNSNQSKITNSEFFNETNQAHGSAGSISQPKKGLLKLKKVTYSTCPPVFKANSTTTSKPVKAVEKKAKNTTQKSKQPKASAKSWELAANTLVLNNNTGRAEAYGSKLYLAGYPVVYLPYLNFPLDGRRMSGLLIPKIGISNAGGLDMSLPYYFNLAPNYDLTLSPRLLVKRGGMLEGEFRYLSDYGTSVLDFGYMPHDRETKDARKKLSLHHQWQISPVLSLHGFYHYVSDKNYLTDLSADPSIRDELNLPRGMTLSYENPEKNFASKLRVETFQTVDNSIADKDKPYARLPQLTAHYDAGNPLGWHGSANVDVGHFVKSITDGSATEDSGTRYYHHLNAGYTYAKPWGSVTPSISLKHITTWFNADSIAQQNLNQTNKTASVTQPEFSLTGEMVFQKNTHSKYGTLKQTLKPQLFYAYAPYKNQSHLPNYDTVAASLSYDQLFTNKRFLGSDRLADTNALSLGVNYQLYDYAGLERFNLGVANRFHFDTHQVNLSGSQQRIASTSGVIMRMQGYLTPKLSLMSDFALTGKGKNNFNTSSLSWRPHKHTLVNIGYLERAKISDSQAALKQAKASFMVPVSERWQVFGHGQYDFLQNTHRDFLLGANYESCCYRFAVYGRNYYNNLDEPNENSPNKLVMAELTLKGLAGFSGNLANLLEQKILGYHDTRTPWHDQ